MTSPQHVEAFWREAVGRLEAAGFESLFQRDNFCYLPLAVPRAQSS